MKKYFLIPFIGMLILIAATGCQKNKDTEPIQTMTVALKTTFEIPAVANRSDTGTAILRVLPGNQLEFDITVPNLAGGDRIQAAHIHLGDPASNGPVLVDLQGMLHGNKIMGKVSIRSTFADSLKTAPLYINVHTAQVPSGLVRGQINNPVIWAKDIALNGQNEVPSVSTTTNGTNFLRLTANGTLFSAFQFNSIESGDVLQMAHIHRGAAGTNGPVFIGIAASTNDFMGSRSFMLTSGEIQSLLNDALYVNVHSMRYPSGAVRGQIR